MFAIAQDYFKLERIELAGLKGKVLCQMAYDVYEEFVKAYSEFGSVQYDVLLPEDTEFTKDLREFLLKVCLNR